MSEEKNKIIALATLLFILAIVLLHFIFSQPKKSQPVSSPLGESLSPQGAIATSLDTTPPESEGPVLSDHFPTDSEIQAVLENWHKKTATLKEKKAEKAEKAENVMAIVRGEKLAPPDPWKRGLPPAEGQEVKPEEKLDSIPEEELREGIQSGRYFYAH